MGTAIFIMMANINGWYERCVNLLEIL